MSKNVVGEELCEGVVPDQIITEPSSVLQGETRRRDKKQGQQLLVLCPCDIDKANRLGWADLFFELE